MRHLIVGDIHGCFEEFQELLQVAGLANDDRVIALGDIVDRGPDSPRVLEWFSRSPTATCLMGNHERKHVRSRRGEVRPALSQLITRRQMEESAYEQACATMETFPQSVELREAVLVHGFFEPGVSLAAQKDTVVIGTLTGEEYIHKLCGDPWYALYDGEKPLVVGHHDYLQTGQPLIYRDKVFAIDTGCCHGGRLTGLLLPEFRIISVPARADHWQDLQRQFADVRLSGIADERLTWSHARAIVDARPDHTASRGPESDRAERVRELLQAGERATTRLWEAILRQHEDNVARIRQEDSRYDHMPPKRQGSRYAAQIGKSPLGKFLHLARKGRLDRETVQNGFCGPHELVEFAMRVGVLDPDRP